MKLIIDIPEEDYKFIKDLHFYISGRRSGKTIERNVINGIKNGKPLPNITDEQIIDAFQIAIVNYWESKSKYLTPPPTPCDCPIKKQKEANDNALTVEITEEQAIVKLHETGWLPRHDKEMTKSSTGHWIITNRKYELKDKDNTFIGMYHKCSECGFDEARGGKFCLNCGAYMGGGR